MLKFELKKDFELIARDFVVELRQAVLKQVDLAGHRFAVIAKATAWGRFYARNKANAAKHIVKRAVVAIKTRGKKDIGEFKRKRGVATFTYPAGVTLDRLLFTKRFVNNAYKSEAFNDHATIYASTASYSEGVSFADIVRYNCKGSDEVNPKIIDPPLIFPTKPKEVMQMQAWKILQERHLPRIRREIVRQLRSQVVRRVVTVKL